MQTKKGSFYPQQEDQYKISRIPIVKREDIKTKK